MVLVSVFVVVGSLIIFGFIVFSPLLRYFLSQEDRLSILFHQYAAQKDITPNDLQKLLKMIEQMLKEFPKDKYAKKERDKLMRLIKKGQKSN